MYPLIVEIPIFEFSDKVLGLVEDEDDDDEDGGEGVGGDVGEDEASGGEATT